jgi:hypothetical protein
MPNQSSSVQPRGVQTSEFWQSSIAALVGVLVMAGVIHPEHASEVTATMQVIAGAVLTLVTTVGYLYTRFILKKTTAVPPLLTAPSVPTSTASTAPSSPSYEVPSALPPGGVSIPGEVVTEA